MSFTAAVADRVAQAVGLQNWVAEAPEIELSTPPEGWASPWLIGVAHEQAATSGDRTRRGAWYTPRNLVEGLVEFAMLSTGPVPRFVVDPTCGGGAFLLAVLDRLVAMGVAPTQAMKSVGGIDIDPGATQAARLALSLWAHSHGCSVEPAIVQGDALVHYPNHWPPPEVVIGNPPFASPLRADAVNDSASQYRTDRQDLFGPYADVAACHLARAVELVCDGGTVCMIQPMSVMSGRDTDRLRKHLDLVAPTRGLWCTREAVFDAGVRVMAPILTRGGTRESVTLASGATPRQLAKARPYGPWSQLAADALGVPELGTGFGSSRTLGDMVGATAGFRDEHYGLAAACVEQAESSSSLRLTTVGSIDPLFGWWGRRPTRFATRQWQRPVIEVELLDERLRRWLANQLRPKVILPTQSKVFEPLVDLDGTLVPTTPVLALHTDLQQLHHVAAVLLAPPVVAWAARHSFGSAMSIDAVKMSATDIGQIPLPSKPAAWDRAAALIANAEIVTSADAARVALGVAEVMMGAYRAPAEVMKWYVSRFPEPR